MHPDFANSIPLELRRLNNWVLWKLKQYDGEPKPRKKPYNAFTGNGAQSNNPRTWSSFSHTCEVFDRGNYDGIGFMFSKGCGYVFFDFDNCIHDGTIDPWVQKWIDKCHDCYVEISQSGKGIHIIAKGEYPWDKGNNTTLEGHDVELYGFGRYIAITGNALFPCEKIASADEAVREMYQLLNPPKKATENPTRGATVANSTTALSDDEILEKICNEKNGAKFRKLLGRDFSDYGGDHSKAMGAFLFKLAFYTNDHIQIDRIVRQSELMYDERDGVNAGKWDRRQSGSTWGQLEIEKAIAKQTRHYNPSEYRSEATADDFTDEGISIQRSEISNLDHFHILDKRGNPIDVFDSRIRDYILEHNHIVIISRTPYIYRGGYFKADENGTQLRHMIEQLIYPERLKSTTVTRVYNLFFNSPEIEASMETMNQYPAEWVNFQNGFYDPVNERMVPHDPQYKATTIIPHSFNPEEKTSGAEIEKWLRYIAPQEDERQMILQYMGYCMTRDTRQQYFLLLAGEGGSGKSVVLKIFGALVGKQNESAVSLHQLSQSHRFYTYQLVGKLLNACGDLDISAIQDTSVIKKLTGEDEIEAEKKGVQPFRFKSFAKLLFSTNEIPTITGERTNGTFRRFLIHQMNGTHQQIPGYEEKLIAEIDHLIHLAMEALTEMHFFGKMTISQASKDAVQQMRRDSDVVEAWLEERTIRDPKATESRSICRDSFLSYCEENNRTPLRSSATLNQAMRDKHFPEVKVHGTICFKGIKLI